MTLLSWTLQQKVWMFPYQAWNIIPDTALLWPMSTVLMKKTPRHWRFHKVQLNCIYNIQNLPLFYFLFPPAGCRAPPSPVNGSIEEYRSTEEGAEIQFHCHDGYTPNEWMSSQCLNSSWSPHSMDLVCVLTPPPKLPSNDYVFLLCLPFLYWTQKASLSVF